MKWIQYHRILFAPSCHKSMYIIILYAVLFLVATVLLSTLRIGEYTQKAKPVQGDYPKPKSLRNKLANKLQ